MEISELQTFQNESFAKSILPALAPSKAAGNFAKGMSAAQLAEEHGDELAPGGKSSGVAIGFGVFNEFLEFIFWKEV